MQTTWLVTGGAGFIGANFVLGTLAKGQAAQLRGEPAVGLTVSDCGIGMSPEQVGRVFERFYRADPSRQQATGEGTGLGLAITHAIVQAHHGQVWATSTKGRTCFTIQLPPTQNEVNC